MKLIIASDIHGSAYYCRKLLDAFEKHKGDRLLLLGDILYHGPRNELPQGYDPKSVASMLNAAKDRLLCVRGNCDCEVDQMMLEFPVLAEYAWLCADGVTIFASHGHKFSPDNPPPLKKGDVLANGHTHIPVIKDMESYTYVNCGSVALPKENSPHSYIIMENGIFTLHELE
ncbi:phosphodiesterase [Ruminococcus sp. Marseille-P6503]|uniref:phosphodiesterase n=1 Tax=Ruminococcus sp. Marseille-P6503 TaxID=2364796 RepID=UPI000F53B9BD|nr:phosphodiesterase [Ruminococcus sp. Marseille-P6503]